MVKFSPVTLFQCKYSTTAENLHGIVRNWYSGIISVPPASFGYTVPIFVILGSVHRLYY